MKVSGYVIALCLLLQSVAQAQAVPPSDTARALASGHFRRGVELFQEGAFRAALVEFQRAYEIAPDHRLLYNIGQTKLELQDYLGAAQSYEGYLSGGYLDIAPERRTAVEEALTALRERVASVDIAVNRKGAEVLIDDVKVGVAPLSTPVLINKYKRKRTGGRNLSADAIHG